MSEPINLEDLTPEEICELVNNGATFSVSEDNSATVTPQSETVCSPVLVKDASHAAPVVNLIDNSVPTGTRPPFTSTFTPSQTSSQDEPTVDYDKVKSDVRAKVAALSGGEGNSTTDFDGLDIPDPVDLLYMLDSELATGAKTLHDWQVKFMLDFADSRHTKESPFQAVVQACNSSGKDKYVIAACAVWLCMRYREVECPITSSSGNQLDNQTGAHIDRLCNRANAVFGPLWKINYRYYEFQHKGDLGEPAPSKLKLFATDEPGKAEGFHPIEAGKKMGIFTSETKSIPDSITAALERCTGFTHRVDASSPGLPSGYFYDTCMAGVDRNNIKDIKELNSTQVCKYHITAYQCSHITESEIERIASKLPGGKNNVVFKSSILAEFGTTDEMVVIPSSFVQRASAPNMNCKIPWIPEPHNTAGLDLSDGGAETVLAIRNGNKLIGLEAFRFEDSEDTISYLQELFKQYDLNRHDALIFGDYCGMGGPMLKSLKRKGWSNMRYVDSRNKAAEPKTYSNRGTELFFNMRKLLEGNELILMHDKLLMTQLSTRYYKISNKNVHQLLSKLEQKAKGYPSPDRADAVNLCFWNYKSTKVAGEDTSSRPFKIPEVEVSTPEGDFDMKVWATKGSEKFNVEHSQFDDFSELRQEVAAFNNMRRKANTLVINQ